MLGFLVGLILSGQNPALQSQESFFPKPIVDQPAPDFVSWPGFGYLPDAGRQVVSHFKVPGDWSRIESTAFAPTNAQSIVWKMRIFVLRRIDGVKKLPDGTLYEEQCSLETPDMERIARAVVLLQKIVDVETHGRLVISPILSIESSPILTQGRTVDQACTDYIYPRANGGKYLAEDHVDRGPYESILCLHPVPVRDPLYTEINGTPTAELSVYGPIGYEADGQLAISMANCWIQSVKTLARRSGVLSFMRGAPASDPATTLENPERYVPDSDWTSVFAGQSLPADKIQARTHLNYGAPTTASLPEGLMNLGYKGPTCQAKITTDPVRGSVLEYSEKGEARNGGLCFPSGPDPIQTKKTPTLSFWAKSDSKDPIALELADSTGQTFNVCLGEDQSGDAKTFRANFDRDGQWHQLRIDLGQTGFEAISQIRLVPTPNSRTHPKITLGPIVYDFAQFTVGSDPKDGELLPPTPDQASHDPLMRARWAHAAAPSSQLAALLKDPDWIVRLNAIQAYIAQPDPSLEKSLTDSAMVSIDGPVAVAGLEAIWKLATPTAKAAVYQTILTGVTEQGKSEAASLVAELKLPEDAAKMIVLLQSKSLETRMAAVDALAKLPGDSAVKIRMAFINQDDPQLKLEVTRTMDPTDSFQTEKLLWSAVNEGSDAVRLESYEKLIVSNDAAAKTNGFAGIKDDSQMVRIQLLNYLEAHPNEENRPALRQAVTDRSPLVRAAAVRAFATLEKEVKPEELGTALQDPHPIVQLAVLQFARKKKFALPAETVKQISESGDPDVVASFKTLAP